MTRMQERWKNDGGFLGTVTLDPITGEPISTPNRPLTDAQIKRFSAIQDAWDAHDRTGDRSGLVAMGILPAEPNSG